MVPIDRPDRRAPGSSQRRVRAEAEQRRGGGVELLDRGREPARVARPTRTASARCSGRPRRRRRTLPAFCSPWVEGARERRAGGGSRGDGRAALRPRPRRASTAARPRPERRQRVGASGVMKHAQRRQARSAGTAGVAARPYNHHAAWARSSSSTRPAASGRGGSRRRRAGAAGARRPRSCSAAGASPAACTRSARCARSTCCRSTGPSTSSTCTSAPAPGRSSPPRSRTASRPRR